MNIKKVISEWLAEATQHECFGVIYFDVDDFRWHNDSFGHAFGDRTLQRIEEKIDNNVPSDNAHWLRTGGNTYFIMLLGSHANNTFKLAETLRSSVEGLNIKLIENPAIYPKDQVQWLSDTVTVSVGTYIQNTQPLNRFYEWSLLELAEAACRFAKHAGKNKVINIDMR